MPRERLGVGIALKAMSKEWARPLLVNDACGDDGDDSRGVSDKSNARDNGVGDNWENTNEWGWDNAQSNQECSPQLQQWKLG